MSSSASQKLHIVFAGNPGVGKSFILNNLVGNVQFKAGLAFGEGLTKVLKSYKDPTSDITYSDTPGLDDVNIRDNAAKEISLALQDSSRLKLIFVCTLEDGRVRPSDLTTIRIILQAIKNANVDTTNGYSVIINKCNDREMELLESPRNQDKVRASFVTVQRLEHIGFFPRLAAAAGVDDYLLDNAEVYSRFVDSAPILRIPEPEKVKVDATGFDKIKEELEKELDALKKKLAHIEKEKNDNKYRALFDVLLHSVVSTVTGKAWDHASGKFGKAAVGAMGM